MTEYLYALPNYHQHQDQGGTLTHTQGGSLADFNLLDLTEQRVEQGQGHEQRDQTHNTTEGHTNTEGGYVCHVCDKVYRTKHLFESHSSVHGNLSAEKKQFKCPTCSITFSRKHDLTRHIRTHFVDQKPFVCENCAKSFSRKDAFTRHQKMKSYQNRHCRKPEDEPPLDPATAQTGTAQTGTIQTGTDQATGQPLPASSSRPRQPQRRRRRQNPNQTHHHSIQSHGGILPNLFPTVNPMDQTLFSANQEIVSQLCSLAQPRFHHHTQPQQYQYNHQDDLDLPYPFHAANHDEAVETIADLMVRGKQL